MTLELQKALGDMSPIQLDATTRQEGATLVLAGPGAGKTRVLTTRIARILEESRGQNFRILALTFTTKAAGEMTDRVSNLVPGLVERTFIGTFHAFCTQLLRQHGSHLGIKADFGIYDQLADREALLLGAIREASKRGEVFHPDDVKLLGLIDRLRASLVLPEKVSERVADAQLAARTRAVYELYEQALRANNVMDFNGLILDSCRLLRDVPAVAQRIRRSYRYWLIDEFQDTSPAQYKFVRLLGGDEFKNVFVVADDDQIIYQWAGASYRQIELFRKQYTPELIQLVENHRCPPDVVDAANKLVAYNTQRTPNKTPIVAAKTATAASIVIQPLETDTDERKFVADDIVRAGSATWGQTAILARTRQTLTAMIADLRSTGVKATLVQRRDHFVSAQFAWLQALLDQALRPNDRIVFGVLVDTANRMIGAELEPSVVMAEAEARGVSFLEQWTRAVVQTESDFAGQLAALASRIVQSRTSWKQVVSEAIPLLVTSSHSAEGVPSDAEEDRAAWDACYREIRTEKGGEPDLNELVQGISLRSKEPPRDPGAVALMTVHAAKGLEFDRVYVIGLAESVLPSWQSLQKGDDSIEMEEERRNCFVAITRTRERLTLSFARTYGNWQKQPSRFLREMGLAA
jgi:DNA helicase II / ATP-dependent DNA helicase PcrA